MKVIESIFREYDIRGTYPEEINEDRCEGEVTYETCELWINK